MASVDPSSFSQPPLVSTGNNSSQPSVANLGSQRLQHSSSNLLQSQLHNPPPELNSLSNRILEGLISAAKATTKVLASIAIIALLAIAGLFIGILTVGLLVGVALGLYLIAIEHEIAPNFLWDEGLARARLKEQELDLQE